MVSDQLWSHTEELSELNSTLILGEPLSALSAGNHQENRNNDNSVISW